MNYFSNCKSINEIKTEYRTLAKKYHPDVNPGISDETMKEINNQYHEALKRFDGFTSKGSDNQDHTYRYDQAIEQEIIDKVIELLKLNMKNVEIEIIGTWIWISGNTKPYRTELKQAKCVWHSKRYMWYFRKMDYRRRYSNMDMNDLRDMYGSKKYDTESENKIVAA